MAIGFPPRYKTEIDIAHLAQDRARILAMETIGNIGWKIFSTEENTIVAYTNFKDPEYDEIVEIEVSEDFINFKSKSVKSKFYDKGQNKNNSELFVEKFEETTSMFEGKDLIDLGNTYNQVNLKMGSDLPISSEDDPEI